MIADRSAHEVLRQVECPALHQPHAGRYRRVATDAGGFYQALSVPLKDPAETVLVAGAAGIAVGAAAAILNRKTKGAAVAAHEKVTVKDLTKES